MFRYRRLLRATAMVGLWMLLLTGCEIFNVPLLEIYSPQNGQQIEGTSVEVIGVARDGAGISRLVYVLSNDEGSSEERDILPFYNVNTEEFRFTIEDLVPGTNRISVIAFDAESTRGNVTVTVTVPDGSVLDPGEFTVALDEPQTGAVIRGDRLGVVGQITGEEIDLAGFTASYTLNGASETRTESAIDTTTGAIAFAIEGLIEGRNSITVSVADAAGTTESFELDVTSEPGTAIEVAIDSPTSGESFDATPIPVAGTIDTIQSIATLSYTVNDGDPVSVDGTWTEGVSEPNPDAEGDAVVRRFDYLFDLEGELVRGANVLEITAADFAGNIHTASVTWTYNGEGPAGTNTRLCATMVEDGGVEAGATSWSGDFTLMQYGEPSAPTQNDAGPEFRGDALLAGGVGERTTATQTIDLSAFGVNSESALIFELSAHLGALNASPDTATIELTFLDASNVAIDRVTLDAVTAGQRGSVTGLLERNLDGEVPAGTMKIEIFIEFLDRDGDEQIAAFADELSLILIDATQSRCLLTVPAKGATVSGSAFHALAIRQDGTVIAWGDNNDGQLGDGSYDATSEPVVVSGIDGILAIATSDSHSLALDIDGRVFAWGDNRMGQLGAGAGSAETLAIPTMVLDGTGEAVLEGVIAIAATRGLSFALTEDGRVLGWGDNSACSIGNPQGETISLPRNLFPNGAAFEPAGLSAARGTLAILAADGSVWTMGSNEFGKLGLNDVRDSDRCNVSQVLATNGTDTLTNVVEIEAGSHHFIARLGDGAVVTWGANDKGQLGSGTTDDSLLPTPARMANGELGDAIAVTATGRRTLALRADGTLTAWGLNDREQSIIGVRQDLLVATPIPELSNVIAAAAYADGLLVLDASGVLHSAGDGLPTTTLTEGIMAPASDDKP